MIQYFQPALQQNITLKRIVGKLPPGIVSSDLKDNLNIEGDIVSKFETIDKDDLERH